MANTVLRVFTVELYTGGVPGEGTGAFGRPSWVPRPPQSDIFMIFKDLGSFHSNEVLHVKLMDFAKTFRHKTQYFRDCLTIDFPHKMSR